MMVEDELRKRRQSLARAAGEWSSKEGKCSSPVNLRVETLLNLMNRVKTTKIEEKLKLTFHTYSIFINYKHYLTIT